MKTSELTGAALDWAVAKCEGWIKGDITNPKFCVLWRDCTRTPAIYPSTNWSQGGPIIEREEVYLSIADNKHWWAEVRRMDDGRQAYHTSFQKSIVQEGPTPLIAAMRCFVASKLGDEVEVPDGLL